MLHIYIHPLICSFLLSANTYPGFLVCWNCYIDQVYNERSGVMRSKGDVLKPLESRKPRIAVGGEQGWDVPAKFLGSCCNQATLYENKRKKPKQTEDIEKDLGSRVSGSSSPLPPSISCLLTEITVPAHSCRGLRQDSEHESHLYVTKHFSNGACYICFCSTFKTGIHGWLNPTRPGICRKSHPL